jgi:hypothetical protein
MLTLHNIEQRSAEWHKLREGRFTASNAGKLLEFGPHKALEPSTFTGNKWTERGLILEPEAIELYERVKQIDVLHVGFVTNSHYPNCGASPDGLTDRLIEVKCFEKDKHLSINLETIPFEVMAQLQFGMMICEMETADLVLYNPDVDAKDALKIISVERDIRIFNRILEKIALYN